MKKIILILASLMISNAALAAFALPSTGNWYKITDCSLLANDIKIILTSNVVGGVQCDTTNNRVALSVCHTSGQTNGRSATVTDPNNTPNNANDDCNPATDTNKCVQTVTGSVFPAATTDNGTVVQYFPGSSCDTANVGSHADSL